MSRVETRTLIICAVIGAICLVVAVVAGTSAVRQWNEGERIDAAPQRVDGVIERVVPEPKGNVRLEITYAVGSHHYSTSREAYELPRQTAPKKGATLCLEVAASAPSVNRLCGRHYPAGDDMMPTYVLLTVAGIIGVLICAGFVIATHGDGTSRRSSRGPEPVTSRNNSAGPHTD